MSMFAVREIAISLSFFFLLYCSVSVIVVTSGSRLKRLRLREKTLAKTLFGARVLPLFGSAAITFAFVIPSFQLLEPRASQEETGRLPVALGVAAIFLIAFGCCRGFKAHMKTARIVAGWLGESRPHSAGAYAILSRRNLPPLAVVGLRSPRMLVSDLAIGLLTENEMAVALRHEQGHIRSRDNLKKLISQFCPFPGMGQIERAWVQAAELAADAGAVSSPCDAIDLASALVKVSRLVPVESGPMCTVGFASGSVALRVARLLQWDGKEEVFPRIPGWAAISILLATAILFVVTYIPALIVTHEITELLVR